MFLVSDPNRSSATPFIESMQQQGYRHTAQQRWVQFEKVTNKIIVHRFIKDA